MEGERHVGNKTDEEAERAFIAVFDHSQRKWNYFREMTANCVCLLLYLFAHHRSVCVCVCVNLCVHTEGFNSSLTI